MSGTDWADMLPSLISIAEASVTIDAIGGEIRTSQDIYQYIPCSIQEADPVQVLDYQRRGVVCTHNIFFQRFEGYTGVPVASVITDQDGRKYIATMPLDMANMGPFIELVVEYRAA